MIPAEMPRESRKIRVAILAGFPLESLDTGATGRGGGQGCTWLPQLAIQFQAYRDLEIHWLVLDRRHRQAMTVQAYGQTFHRLPAVKFSLDLLLHQWPARMTLRRVLRGIQPDVVHAWGTELIYPAALQDCTGPTILSMQGVLGAYQKIGGLPDDWRWRRMVATEPAFLRSATVITSESQWGIERVREIHPEADCRMVEYGVHPDFYDVEWNPRREKPYALYVGGSGTRKGFDLLVDALRLSGKRDWEMRLAGDNDMERLCREADVGGVQCLGLLSWDALREQLAGAWCVVLPTRGDTSPNSVKEARVIGLPVITSTHGGQAGYIRDEVNGKIVEPLEAAGLAAALADVMGNYDRARALGAGSHQEDREYLHPKRTARGFAALYRELSARR